MSDNERKFDGDGNFGGFNIFDKIKDIDFEGQIKKKKGEMKNLNIIVAGKTGVGKSTLLNAIFGKDLAKTGIGTPITQDCTKYTLNDCSITIYDTKGFETGENNHEEQIFKKIFELNSGSNTDDYIHICWYCIADMGNRIEPNEVKFINDVLQYMKVPVIIVLTKSLGGKNPDTKLFIEKIEKEFSGMRINIIPVMAKAMDVKTDYGEMKVNQHDVDKLVDITREILPASVRLTFETYQVVDIEPKIKNARKLVITYAGAVSAAAFQPLPIADAPIMMGIQVAMLAHITAVFGIPPSKFNFISALTGIGMPFAAAMAGRTVVSLLKFIPGFGTAAGTAINAATGGAITLAIGNVYIEVLVSAVKSGDINLDTLKEGLQNGMKGFNMDTYKKQWEESKNNYDESEAERILNEAKDNLKK